MKSTKTPDAPSAKERVSYWREKSDKQKLLINSILSLLNKYGNCLDLSSLHSEFVLTLMGHYIVTDACLFVALEDSGNLDPGLKFGGIRFRELPSLETQSALVRQLNKTRSAQLVDSLPEPASQTPAIALLKDTIKLIGPIYVENKLVGIVMLGKRVSGQPYSEFDLALLNTLCAVSAIAFNNANLIENVKCSVEEVQRLMDLRDEMISRISHEFRTPLTIIKSGLSHLNLDDEEQRAVCHMIAGAADRFAELVDSLLVLDRRHGMKHDPHRHGFNPVTPVYNFVADHAAQASKKGLTFEIKELPDRNTLLLKIRREDFSNVVEQLMMNAIKFSADNSIISVGFEIARRVPDETDGVKLMDWKARSRKTLDEYKKLLGDTDEAPFDKRVDDPELMRSDLNRRPYLLMSVTNTGIGIPQEELENIAQPFSQASNSPDQRVHGKALGLAIVQKILSDCRALLFCRSEEDGKTTFSVFLPLAGS